MNRYEAMVEAIRSADTVCHICVYRGKCESEENREQCRFKWNGYLGDESYLVANTEDIVKSGKLEEDIRNNSGFICEVCKTQCKYDAPDTRCEFTWANDPGEDEGMCTECGLRHSEVCESCMNNKPLRDPETPAEHPAELPPINAKHQPRKDPWDVVTFVLCAIMMVLAATISAFNAFCNVDGARITAIPYWALLAGYWAIRLSKM